MIAEVSRRVPELGHPPGGLTLAEPSARSAVARDKLMSAAERLYAEQGFANVSIRMVGEEAGQRNKSAVQYHFAGRDELVMAVLARHIAAIEKHRIAMVEALADVDDGSTEQWISCLIVPTIEHHIELGTPAWYARFLAQVVVEPNWREYTERAHADTPSLRRLDKLTQTRRPERDREVVEQYAAMIRQLTVHMCAELEYDLAHGHVDPRSAEKSWRRLGASLIKAGSGLTVALLGNR